MASQKGLGRGLGALLGDMNPSAAESGGVTTVSLQKIEPNPLQPRKSFDEAQLAELAESIRLHGVIQPLTVRKLPNGYYQIIAGERRWRASRIAGLSELPVVVIEADDRKAMELALIENLQRADLDPIEEAQGYRQLVQEYGLTQEQAAECVGKSRPAVANALRLLSLPEAVLELVQSGKLSAGHARAILSLPTPQQQTAIAQKVAALDLSVRQTEALCKKFSVQKKPAAEKPLEVDYLAECEKTLSKRLNRGVHIVSGKRKGRVELEYYGEDDLQKIYEALLSIPGKEHF